MRALLLLIATTSALALPAQSVMINEFMAANESTILDEDGDYSDWIELHNPTETAVDLSGWFLSDDPGLLLKWRIEEASIPPQGFLLLFASDKARPGPGELHTDFRIASGGEPLYLSDEQGILVHQTPAIALEEDMSYGSLTDGDLVETVLFLPATPGASNAGGTIVSQQSDALSFSSPAGFYEEAIALELSSAQGHEIRYTLDGSEPSPNSAVYSAPLFIADRAGDLDEISRIPTGVGWENPQTHGEKATVIKAASFAQGLRRSQVHTASYFISERMSANYKGLPVISLSVDADSLFSSERGIYVPGDAFIPSEELSTGNYQFKGRDWEREMHMEYFNADHEPEFAHQIGARVHGKSSRRNPQKTLRLYARGDYGASEFEHRFFEDKEIDRFKRILLRSPASDFGGTMFRDEFCARLVTEMQSDYMASQLCVVFINGEYWGLHSIRERIDEHYLVGNHSLPNDSVNLLELNGLVEEGTAADFEDLMHFVETHDMREPMHYAEVQERIDLDNLMDYTIAQLYLANFDWPFVNIRYWQSAEDTGPWRWIFHDCDRCMLNHHFEHLDDLVLGTEIAEHPPQVYTRLLNQLLKNAAFREELVQRFVYHLSTTFETNRVLAEIDRMEALYTPFIREHNARWNYPGSVNFWSESVDEMRAFAVRRPAIMIQQILDYFGDQYRLYPNPVSNARGYVNLASDYIEGLDNQVQVYTIMGEKVLETSITGSPGEQGLIAIGDLPAGLYVLRMQVGLFVLSEKLVVE